MAHGACADGHAGAGSAPDQRRHQQVLADAAVQKRLEDLAMQVRPDSTPESAQRWLQAEMAKWEPIIRDAGIKPD